VRVSQGEGGQNIHKLTAAAKALTQPVPLIARLACLAHPAWFVAHVTDAYVCFVWPLLSGVANATLYPPVLPGRMVCPAVHSPFIAASPSVALKATYGSIVPAPVS
jgi:hypothetical protein